MTTESVVFYLFWYGLAGWCTAELHRHSGFYSRCSSCGRWFCWAVTFMCWPAALPLYVDYIGDTGKRNGDDE
ncbi:hypothetical protein [Morganella morganii]|uniref:hypothetical protein n=1 Tax=Morganella morganii TaxID=582 RepID=UPI0033061A97